MYLKQKADYIRNLGYTQKLNCWGATLLLLKEKRRLGWVSEERMEKFLKQKTKNVNNAHKGLKLGDILVIRDEYGDLVHTAVYVDKDKWFHKKGGLDSSTDDSTSIIYRYEVFGADNWEIRRLK